MDERINFSDFFTDDFARFVKSQGFKNLTEAQEKFIPVVRSGKNAVLISPTGSGKTEAAIFPILDRIRSEDLTPVSCIFITPLRALNRDMLYRLKKYGESLGLKVQVRHSDISENERREIRDNPAPILITTPESLQILLNSKKMSNSLKNVKFVIVDELHEMAQNERGTQLSIGLERLKEIAGNFQRIGLSATVGNPEEISKFLSPQDPVEIVHTSLVKSMDFLVEIPEKAPEEVSNKMGCDPDYAGAIKRIHDLVMSHSGTLVFVNTRSVAEDISFRLSLYYGDIPVMVHHGSLSRDIREEAERKFKASLIKGLICTSSLELGIDIGTADLVIQFNSPRQINKLIQRIGRSGHWIGSISKGIILCTDIIELEEANAIVNQIQESVLEPVLIREKSMATLANQVLLRVHQLRKFDSLEFYRLIHQAYPFRNLSYEEYEELLIFLNDSRRIHYKDGNVTPGYGSLDYFIGNISMIPSEKNYRVIDIIQKKFVGTLDERYVLNEIEPGSYFVIRGSTWRTIRLDEDKILVEPFRTAALTPKWTGEDIPVLPDVTFRVSENRRMKVISKNLEEKSAEKLAQWYMNDIGLIDRVIVETKGNEVIIQILLGTKANFALSEIMASIISAFTGESVETDYSPYHIYLRSSMKIGAEEIVKTIRSLSNRDLISTIENTARRSRFFNGVFLYEARKFGIIKKDADMSRIRMEKIVDSYRSTILYRDSVRKMMYDYMDIDELNNFLKSLDKIEFVTKNGFSDGTETFLTHYSERIAPLKPTKAIVDSIRERLLNEEITLICTRCFWTHTDKVLNIKNTKCKNCGSSLVAAISPYEKDSIIKAISQDKITAKEKNALSKSAHLVRERGRDALMVLAGRGIGPETASRLLSVRYLNDDDLIQNIIRSENDFSKNRRYWN
ncbi:DEAD/DEAH box helicase [Cuniculiplasma sp. SKW3]|uniref:DEAD/DEAH box helicase n=1 Tax=Cuniculiplasma sp. SKW3 TaxID=3400170 RepID=UPI003FD4E423